MWIDDIELRQRHRDLRYYGLRGDEPWRARQRLLAAESGMDPGRKHRRGLTLGFFSGLFGRRGSC